jgi:hypothetical protein
MKKKNLEDFPSIKKLCEVLRSQDKKMRRKGEYKSTEPVIEEREDAIHVVFDNDGYATILFVFSKRGKFRGIVNCQQ